MPGAKAFLDEEGDKIPEFKKNITYMSVSLKHLRQQVRDWSHGPNHFGGAVWNNLVERQHGLNATQIAKVPLVGRTLRVTVTQNHTALPHALPQVVDVASLALLFGHVRTCWQLLARNLRRARGHFYQPHSLWRHVLQSKILQRCHSRVAEEDKMQLLAYLLVLTGHMPAYRSFHVRTLDHLLGAQPGLPFYQALWRRTQRISANYVPPFTLAMLRQTQDWDIRDPPPGFWSRAVRVALSHETPVTARWIKQHWFEVMRYADIRAQRYAYRALAAQAAQVRTQQFTQRRPQLGLSPAGCAFAVDPTQCQFTAFQKYVVVSWEMHRRKYRCVLNRASVAQHLRPAGPWVFVRHGTYFGPRTPRFISQAVSKFQGRVPRLRVLLEHSEGLLWSVAVLRDYVSGLPANSEWVHGHDVTTYLPCYQRVTPAHSVRRARRMMRLFQDAPVPLPTRTWLTPIHVEAFAHDLQHRWNFPTRAVFYSLGWRLGYIKNWNFIVHTRPTIRSLVRVVLHRFVATPQLVSTWLPHQANGHDKPHATALREFWRPFESHLTPLAYAVRQLVLRPTFNAFDCLALNAVSDPVLSCLIRLCVSCKLPLLPQAQRPPLTLLYKAHIPPAIRRLAWHTCSLLTRRIVARDWSRPLIESDLPFDLPNPQIQIPFTSPLRDAEAVYYQRAAGHITNTAWLRQYARDMLTPPDMFELRVQHEAGRGVAVHHEVLEMFWNTLLRKHVLTMYQDEGGICVGHAGHANAESPETRDALFTLGFVSGLCVSRGLYLPYPLYVGWWRFLYAGDEDDFDVAMVFRERVENLTRMCGQLTSEDLAGCEANSRSDYIRQFLPNQLGLEEFRLGWSVFMHRLPLQCVINDLNLMFCTPKRLTVNADNFATVFRVRNLKDQVFLQYVHTLTAAQVKRLVHFITGKDRLPFLALGEERIKVAWNATLEDHQFRSQNCTHTLILSSRAASVPALKALLNRIYEFDTVYGFL